MAGSSPDGVESTEQPRARARPFPEFRERQRVELTGGCGGSSPLMTLSEFYERQRVELTGGRGGSPPLMTQPSGFRTSVCVVAAATALRVRSIGQVRSASQSSAWSA
jgi:hypothetical protein